jgi:hypothetical protein
MAASATSSTKAPGVGPQDFDGWFTEAEAMWGGASPRAGTKLASERPTRAACRPAIFYSGGQGVVPQALRVPGEACIECSLAGALSSVLPPTLAAPLLIVAAQDIMVFDSKSWGRVLALDGVINLTTREFLNLPNEGRD